MIYKPVYYLEKGALIHILCTARSAQENELKPTMHFLESLGYAVQLGKTIGKVNNQLGGTVEERVNDFITAYNNPNVKAIWIARGGYGTVQIIDAILAQLKSSLLLKEFKHPLVMGYSDVTVLHTALQSYGLQSLHSFMPLETAKKPENVKSVFKALICGKSVTVSWPNKDCLPSNELSAPVIGGNLSILYSLLGSTTLPDFKNHILFIEDIDEYLYHIERMLYALKRAGKLDGLKALLVGGMTAMRDHDIPFGKTAQEIITDLTASYDYPVVFNCPAGHIEGNNPIMMGKMMHLKINASTISYTQ